MYVYICVSLKMQMTIVRLESLRTVGKILDMGVVPCESDIFAEILSRLSQLVIDPSEAVRELVVVILMSCCVYVGANNRILATCGIYEVIKERLGTCMQEPSEEIRIDLLKLLDNIVQVFDSIRFDDINMLLVNSLNDSCSGVILGACDLISHHPQLRPSQQLWDALHTNLGHRHRKVRISTIETLCSLEGIDMSRFLPKLRYLVNDEYVKSTLADSVFPPSWQSLYISLLLGKDIEYKSIQTHLNDLVTASLLNEDFIVLTACAPHVEDQTTVEAIVRKSYAKAFHFLNRLQGAETILYQLVEEALDSETFEQARAALLALDATLSPMSLAHVSLLNRCSHIPLLAPAVLRVLRHFPWDKHLTIVALRCGAADLDQSLVDSVFLMDLDAQDVSFVKSLVRRVSKRLVQQNRDDLLRIGLKWSDPFDRMELAYIVAHPLLVHQLVFPCLSWQSGYAQQQLRTIGLLVCEALHVIPPAEVLLECMREEDCVNNRYLAVRLAKTLGNEKVREGLLARKDDLNETVRMEAALF